MGIFASSVIKALRPRSRMTGSSWADVYRAVAPGTSPEPGEWRTSRVPYLREPMDAATDKRTEMVVLMCSSQLGKSEALLNILGYYVDQEPAPILMLQPTIEAAENFSKERIEPTFAYSPGLKDKMEQGQDGRSNARKKSTTIRMKHFPGGYLALVGANSPSGLASRPIRVLLCDEVDRYGSTKEGDPLKLALQRTTNFHNRKICIVSTPTLKGVSTIEQWYERSDKRQYYVPCQHCGHEHVLTWELVHWEKDENGVDLPESAYMVCPSCGKGTRGAWKPDITMLQAGRWRSTAPGASVRGYHLNSLYSPWVNLSSLVEEYVAAIKSTDKTGLQEFVNLKLGLPYDVEDFSTEWGVYAQRAEPYGETEVPEGVLLLTCGVDVQHNRLELVILGWGLGGECWAIRYIQIWGSPMLQEVWQSLDVVLQSRYVTTDGRELPIACTCVDSGDGNTSLIVYNYTKRREHMRVFSIKGRGGLGVPFISKPTTSNRVGANLFVLGVDGGKSLVYNRLKTTKPGPGYVHFPSDLDRGFDEEFFKGLFSEKLDSKFEKGRVKVQWVKVRERNEALDTFVYATAACELIAPNYEALQRLKDGGRGSEMPRSSRRHRGTRSRGVEL